MPITAFDSLLQQLQQILFVTWTCIKTYGNGPYYSFVEFNRNYGLFGKTRKLTAEDGDLPSSLVGKVCIITGGSRGIGVEVVKTLLKKGCHVITGSSANEEEIQKRHSQIMEDLGDSNKGVLEIWSLDLSSMESVKEFVSRFKGTGLGVNYLLCNGGVMFTPFNLTKDGFENQLAINYLSHCLLIWHLTPILVQSAIQCGQKSRIVCVSSGLHRPGKIRLNDLQSEKLYSTYHAYAQSKLAQIMFAYKFSQWLLSNKEYADYLNITSLHPGICRTDLMNGFGFFKLRPIQSLPIFRSAQEGAETIIYAALSSELEGVSGVYLEDFCVTKSSKKSLDSKMQDELWRKTWQLLKQWADLPEELVKEPEADKEVITA